MVSKVVGKRSRDEAQRTRIRILDAAEALFAERGFDGVTTRAIAARSGVHHTAVLHHFGTKLALYRDTLFRWDARLGELLAAALGAPGATPALLVGRAVDVLFDFFAEHRDWLILNTRALAGEGLPEGVPAKDLDWLRFAERTFRLGGGRLGAHVDAGMLMITIEGIVTHHVLATSRYREMFDGRVSEAALLERAKQHVKAAVLATAQAAFTSSYQGGEVHGRPVAVASPR